MKYDSKLGDLKETLSSAKKILIFLPSEVSIDELASGLSLMLALKNAGKETALVSQANLLVAQSNLFGIGEIKKEISANGSGNFTLSLEGVVNSDGKIPSLEKLDWFPEGNNLNLVFHILEGQKFEPTNIKHFYQGSNFDIVFVLGAATPAQLGSIYTQNFESFKEATLINIDNDATNTVYGTINIVDQNSGSLSEMVVFILQSLGLVLDQDIATNLVNGIYSNTSNLTQKVTPDSFMAIGTAMQSGAKMPTPDSLTENVVGLNQASSQAKTFATDAIFSSGQNSSQNAPFINPVVAEEKQNNQYNSSNLPFMQSSTPTPSSEERPIGEVANSPNPETANPAPDWLTPKIFKGGGNVS